MSSNMHRGWVIICNTHLQFPETDLVIEMTYQYSKTLGESVELWHLFPYITDQEMGSIRTENTFL